MRNLKKLFAVLLVVAMMATTMVSAFADDVTLDAPAKAPAKAATPAKATTESAISYNANIAKTIGMLKGAGAGVTTDYLATTPTRLQSIIMFLRLKGLEDEALAFKGTDNFADADQAGWDGGKAIMAYVKANSDKLGIKGVGDNKLDPGSLMTAQDYYKVMLETLGYKQDVDFKYAEVIKFAATKNLSKVASVTKFTVDNLATATVEALNAVVKGGKDVDTLSAALLKAGKLTEDNVKLITTPEPTPVPTTLTYDSLTAKSATSLLAKFNRPVSDTAKIAFTVKRGPVAETLTATWNKEKTEAALAKTSRLVAGDYTVSVTNDKADLGSKTVKVEQEKIASITFNSDMLIRFNDTQGQAGFTVKNQYGDDITDSSLARGIDWSPKGTATEYVTVDNGILTYTKNISPTNQLKDVPTSSKVVIVSAVDQNSGLVATKTLTVSDTIGGISELKFNGIINPDGKTDITVGAVDKFYIDYEAKDINGSKLDSYDIISNAISFYTSNSNIKASVVKDPNDNKRALIEITDHTADGTAVITGLVTSTGKSATLTVVVKKDATLYQLDMQVPSSDVTINDKTDIPFTAMDQDGNVLTSYSDVYGSDDSPKVDITTNPADATVYKDRNADGSFRLAIKFPSVKQYTVTAIVKDSAKMSQIVIDAKAQAYPYELNEIKTNVISGAIVKNSGNGGGQITADFKDNLAFTVLDQYGRDFNMTDDYTVTAGGVTTYYYVDAVPNDKNIVGVLGEAYGAFMTTGLQLVGGSTKGSTSVTFELCSDTRDPATSGYFTNGLPSSRTVIDSKTVTISNVEKTDIAGYEINKIDTLYANSTADHPAASWSKATPQQKAYARDIKVMGKLSNGLKVALNPSDILNYNVSDSVKFSLEPVPTPDPATGLSTNAKVAHKIMANSLASFSDDTAKARVVATVKGGNDIAYTIYADINSSKAEPQAKNINAKVKFKATSGITKDGDSTFNISAANFPTLLANVAASTLNKFSVANDSSYGSSNPADTQDLWFDVNDQYNPNTKAMSPSFYSIAKTKSGTGSSAQLIIDPTTGVFSYVDINNTVKSGDQFTITAVTNNGLTKAIVLNIQ